jgi:dephospho-CoA kinase
MNICGRAKNAAPFLGITGGSGAGKSLVLDRLEELGAVTIRADTVYHALLLSNTDMLAELRECFPEAFTGPEDRTSYESGYMDKLHFDRSIMRSIAFSDHNALADLNRITHPYVLAEVCRKIAPLKGKGIPIAIEAIALIGSGLDEFCSLKVAVTAPLEVRLRRIMARDGLTREKASERLRSQKTEEYYIAHCNIILKNNGTAGELKKGVDKLWETHIGN